MTEDSLRDLYCTCCHVRRAERKLTRMYEAALEPSGLTAMQFAILAAIARNPSAGRVQIAELLDMDTSTLSRGLAPLMREGLVAVADGKIRSGHLELTADGRKTFEAAVPMWQKAQSAVHKALGGTQTKDLHHLLMELPGEAAIAAR